MTFGSPAFLFIFFPAVFLLYFAVPAKYLRARNAVLTAASLVFYAYGEPFAVFLMLFSVWLSFVCAKFLGQGGKKRKAALILGVAGNLSLLLVFKYTDFFLDTLNRIFSLSIPLPSIRLPVGISFFIFQAISYIIDVSRNQAAAQTKFSSLLLYIAFFPQLIAGPIVRYQTVEQALRERVSTASGVSHGLTRMICGLSKKLLIADFLGRTADTVFGMTSLAMPSAWLGALCYTLQIYYDFSGYSDMALGMGEIFGFKFPENFRHPYCSKSITEFWRRWHISLTTWFREYLYIPLGGNRKGKLRTVLNKWIVFLCTGFWHGASFHYIVWGALNGLLMTLEQTFLKKDKKQRGAFFRHLYTVLMVVCAFVVFRADTLSKAISFYGAMFSFGGLSMESLAVCVRMISPLFLVVFCLAVIGCTPMPARLAEKFAEKRGGAITLKVGSLCLLALCLMSVAATTYHPFLYFRF